MGLSDCPTEQRACEKHDVYTSMFIRNAYWTGCPDCAAEERERQAKEAEAIRQKEFRERRASQLLGRAAIPPRFSDRRLSNYAPQCEQATRALAVAQAYADGFELILETGASLIFCGGVGTGKTHLAVGIAHELLAKDKAVIFSSVMGAVRAVKETYSRDSQKSEGEVIKGFIWPDLLVLDEVGVQFGSDTEKLILFEIINGRYEAMKPTILISNLAKDALASFIGERAFDRLREGGGKLVAFDWPSYRKQS